MLTVPFSHHWADSGCKLDLKGLYRSTKPNDDRWVELPIRRHNDWSAKGLEYVTLATTADVVAVRGELVNQKVDLNELQKSYHMGEYGKFKLDQYWAETPQRDAKESAELRARLAKLDGKKGKGEAA